MSWIKLHRSLKDWEWYDDINATRLLIHLLVSVNYEPKKWKGIVVPAGSMIFSWESLSDQVGLSVKQCRIAMGKLENSGEAARKAARKGQLVSLTKWEKLQNNEKEAARIEAGKGQEKGRKRATTKEVKNYKIEEYKNSRDEFAEQVRSLPTNLPKEEIDKFLDYWTEKNPGGKKMRYQMQKTFDPKRRLKKWEANYFEWKKEKSSAKKENPNGLDILREINKANGI